MDDPHGPFESSNSMWVIQFHLFPSEGIMVQICTTISSDGIRWNWMTHMELDDSNGPCGSSIPFNKNGTLLFSETARMPNLPSVLQSYSSIYVKIFTARNRRKQFRNNFKDKQFLSFLAFARKLEALPTMGKPPTWARFRFRNRVPKGSYYQRHIFAHPTVLPTWATHVGWAKICHLTTSGYPLVGTVCSMLVC